MSPGTGRRVFAIFSIIFSVLVLLLTVAGLIGTWVAYGPTIEVATGVLGGIEQLAQAGQEGVARLDNRITELRDLIGEVEMAAEQIARNVADKGLVLTLLPPEKEEQLQATAQQLADGAASVREVVDAARALRDALARVPFVDLPQPDPERVAATQETVGAVRELVANLENDIQQFREGASTEISKISGLAVEIDNRLGVTQETLAQLDARLAGLEADAGALKQRMPTLITTIAVVTTLLLAWLTYALIMLIRQNLAALRSEPAR